MSNNKFVFFWGGPFSQWYTHKMRIDGVDYSCAEQFMMAMKAQVFNDEDAYEKIMATKDPRKQKAIGRKVRNFDPTEWGKVAKEYVYIANLKKFEDNPLREILLATGDLEIVEASPYDKIWGIGMGEDDPDRFDKTKWRGTNWLGEVLMQVREDLKKDSF